jgi:hypothetical protein
MVLLWVLKIKNDLQYFLGQLISKVSWIEGENGVNLFIALIPFICSLLLCHDYM